MKIRPHFKSSIVDLENAFQDNASDRVLCQAILSELSHRNTQRAQNLKKKIQSADKQIERKSPSVTHQTKPRPKTPNKPAAEIPTKKTPPPIIYKKAGPKPPVTDEPANILKAWTALEVLAPQGFRRDIDLVGGDPKRIADLKMGLPWENGEKSRPNKRLFYELILGTMNLGPAVESLLKVYSDKRPDAPRLNRKTPIASIMLDKNGCPLNEDNSLAISSFAWGVPIALQGDLKSLADWQNQESRLINNFKKHCIHKESDGEPQPLTISHIQAMYNHLINALQLEELDVSPPSFAIRRFEFFASKVPPEPGLLNSFFLEDLGKAADLATRATLPKALSYYLGVNELDTKTDLLEDDIGLRDILQPSLTPLGRWPANGRFPLALLQQAAVNATTEKVNDSGVLSVNGPPGTGKTTLLRDIVAARIIDRATVMAQYEDPARAFTPTKQSVQRQGAKITFHRLDEKLKGFEMVVASSNNKAVENVSAELPSLSAIASDAPNLRYFSSIANNVLGAESWGTISAVLGNNSNRFKFSQAFWRDEENGLSTYLNHICGTPQFVAEQQDSGEVIQRPRRVISEETPPESLREARNNWNVAQKDFVSALEASNNKKSELQSIHDAFLRLEELSTQIDLIRDSLPEDQRRMEAAQTTLEQSIARHEQEQTTLDVIKQQLASHQLAKPGFFARLFRTTKAKHWHKTQKASDQERQQQINQINQAAFQIQEQQETSFHLNRLLEDKQNKLAQFEQQFTDLTRETTQRASKIDAELPNHDFFSKSHKAKQTANLWFDNVSNRQRDLVFEKAIALHKAFIDCAADPLRQNLSVFMESFGTRSLGHPQKDALIADLWASFFLVVPVVSTTFASVNSMFSHLKPESLGWLLVDEAGQALPQAAVGALLRAKRVVAVGDPLQIEPVVTLPNTLTEEICAFFGIDPIKYNAPEASVQTVADMASPYCARFPIGSGHRMVGAPLLVHRRCDSPMFEISNEIAYSNLMVQAKQSKEKQQPLGRSAWIDVVGTNTTDKWCQEEGEQLLEMLKSLRQSGADPEFYVVTPFVIVQDNLRKMLLSSGLLNGWIEKPNTWVYEHVGTVHTVQGREASTVFFILGAQKISQAGARNWAGKTPNLANVAVTRAKTFLYVIGNRQLWRSAGKFSVLDRLLPTSQKTENNEMAL